MNGPGTPGCRLGALLVLSWIVVFTVSVIVLLSVLLEW